MRLSPTTLFGAALLLLPVTLAAPKAFSSHELEKRAPCPGGTYKYEDQCLKSCPTAMFANAQTGRCAWCSSIPSGKGVGASTCSSTRALSCALLYLSDGSCVAANACPVGQYGDANTHTCKSCDGADEATCDGWGALTCKTGFFYARACLPACPARTYANSARACKACLDKDAKECTASRATKCTFKYLQDGACVDPCADGTYSSWSTRTCETCQDPLAVTCSAYRSLTCVAGSTVVGTTCVEAPTTPQPPTPVTCATGQYRDPTRNVCVSCKELDVGATSCDINGVLSCERTFNLVDKACAPIVCDDHFFLDTLPSVPVCTPCTTKFTGSFRCTFDTIISCYSPFFSYFENTCVIRCPSEAYEKYPFQCERCSNDFPSSLQCDGLGATKCKSPTRLYNRACVTTCPDTTYYNAATNECEAIAICDEGSFREASSNKCRTCIGSFGGAKTCTEEKPLSCLDTFYLGLDQFDYTICAKCANNPLFVNRDRINTCDSIAILSCLDGFTLLNGACEPTWARFRNIYAPLAASGSAQNTPECYSLSVTGAVNAFRWEDQLILKTCFLNEVTYGSLTAVQNQYSTYVQGSCTGIKEVNTAIVAAPCTDVVWLPGTPATCTAVATNGATSACTF